MLHHDGEKKALLQALQHEIKLKLKGLVADVDCVSLRYAYDVHP